MADEDDLEARKARAAEIRAEISNILGPGKNEGRKDQGKVGTKAENDSEAVPGKPGGLGPPSPREFIERRMRELDSAKEIGAEESVKDKTPKP